MARKRMIDPGFWIDEKLGMCEPLARFLFAGLISQADDNGRLPGKPALLRSLIFPYDENITSDMVTIWLKQLQQQNMILIYTVDHQTYICIPNFLKHQTIKKPQLSKLPEPPENIDEIIGSEPVENQGENEFGTSTEPVLPKRSEEKGKEEKASKGGTERTGSEPELTKDQNTAASLANEKDPQDAVYEAFLTVSKYTNSANINPENIVEISRVLNRGIPPNFIIQTINAIADERNTRVKATAFSYFTDAIVERWEAQCGQRETAAGRAKPYDFSRTEAAFSEHMMNGGDPDDFDWSKER